jgi:hypothetical protein
MKRVVLVVLFVVAFGGCGGSSQGDTAKTSAPESSTTTLISIPLPTTSVAPSTVTTLSSDEPKSGMAVSEADVARLEASVNGAQSIIDAADELSNAQ